MKKITLIVSIIVVCFSSYAQTTIEKSEPSEISSLDIYPNPFTHDLTVTFSLAIASNVTYEITDELGKIIFTENAGMLSTGSHEVSQLGKIVLHKLYAGRYFFTVYTDKGSKITKPIIKN